MDLKERVEVVEALLHNVEGRLASCIPSQGMLQHAATLRKIGREYIEKANAIENRIAEDTASILTLAAERQRIMLELSVLQSCIRRGISDHTIVANAMAQLNKRK